MIFGEQLKFHRIKKGLSQQELGRKLNVSPQAISKWENNQSQPDFLVIKEIASLFNISYDELFEGFDNGTYSGQIYEYHKDSHIIKTYLFCMLFLAFLAISFFFIAVLTYTHKDLTWQFPLGFGILFLISIVFITVISSFYFHNKKLPDKLFTASGKKLHILELDNIVLFKDIKLVKTREYNISSWKCGVLTVFTESGERFRVRDIADIKAAGKELCNLVEIEKESQYKN